MAPDHKQILAEQKQNFDDLAVRDPDKYRELEQKQKRLNFETSLAVSLAAPGHVRRAEKMS